MLNPTRIKHRPKTWIDERLVEWQVEGETVYYVHIGGNCWWGWRNKAPEAVLAELVSDAGVKIKRWIYTKPHMFIANNEDSLRQTIKDVITKKEAPYNIHDVRFERDKLLKGADHPKGVNRTNKPLMDAWERYRQELRDVPLLVKTDRDNVSVIEDVVWPNPPN